MPLVCGPSIVAWVGSMSFAAELNQAAKLSKGWGLTGQR
jgi:hypothetical protein